MNEEPEVEARKTVHVSQEVGSKAARKLKAQRSKQCVWFGLGMMGLIGWSVVVPTLLGAALGIWLDNRHPGNHSWTLTLLFIGLVIGCLNAWHWVAKEELEMRDERRIRMNETLTLLLSLAAGIVLGAIFFGGLWWTVQKAVSSKRSALWFFCSLLLRTSMVLAGFYFVAQGHWERLLMCLLGFVTARPIVMGLLVSRKSQLTRHRRQAMHLSPDEMIFWQHGIFKLNGTIVFTWGLMLVLAVGSKIITRKLSTGLNIPAGRTF